MKLGKEEWLQWRTWSDCVWSLLFISHNRYLFLWCSRYTVVSEADYELGGKRASWSQRKVSSQVSGWKPANHKAVSLGSDESGSVLINLTSSSEMRHPHAVLLLHSHLSMINISISFFKTSYERILWWSFERHYVTPSIWRKQKHRI